MDLELMGKRALVTGSTAGIGAAIAERLAAEGATVLIHGRRAKAVEEVTDRIRAAGGSARGVVGDLTSEAEVRRVAEAGLDGGIDILVNNAGAYADSTWDRATAEDWLKLYDGNVVAAVRLIRTFVPGMREVGR